VKYIFALIRVLITFKHPKYTMRKNCVDMCARHGRGAIEVCLSEKGALVKKKIGKHWFIPMFSFCGFPSKYPRRFGSLVHLQCASYMSVL